MTACPHRLCVAPMMDWTDRHCRYFHRLLAPRTRLYTEMVTTGALLFGDAARHLAHDPAERPVAFQLGGSEPSELARCAQLAEAAGFDEVNLNCGCPSDRVRRGRFGACLMAEPPLVAACVAAMRAAVRIPVTVKCRIGIDDAPEPDCLLRFVEAIAAAGCQTVIVHARKAWLEGLSPKENREIPPLRPELVRLVKERFPELRIVLNGGLRTEEQVREALFWADGVMIGRQAYEDPWSLRSFEAAAFAAPPPALERTAVIEAMAEYAEARAREGVPFKAIARHMLGLFNGLPGARAWRRRLAEGMHRPDAGPWLLRAAAEAVAGRAALAA
ncbi:MAG: tRNA dihydrouridine(20/20a) synthase DusA [Geminicoccaceae bacterium]|nr:tRNA dihydrouridine(20/20a) synthase DusA [Geminicoccaceae bacterium]